MAAPLRCRCIACCALNSSPQVLGDWILLDEAPGHGLCPDCCTGIAVAAVRARINLFLASRQAPAAPAGRC